MIYNYNKLIAELKNIIDNLSVRKKVFLAPAVSIFFILFLGIVFFTGLTHQKFLIGDIFEKRFRLYQQSSDIVKKINIIHTNMYKGFVWALSGYDQKEVEKLLAEQIPMVDEISLQIKKILESGDLEPDERKTFFSVLYNIDEYKKRADYAKESALVGGDITTASAILQMGDDQFWILYERLNLLMKIQNELSKESFDSSQRSFKNFMIFTVLFVFIALVVSIIINIKVSSLIINPVKLIVNVLRENPGASIDPSKLESVTANDEIGEFARYFREYISEIKTTTHALVEARDELWGEMQLAKKIQAILLPVDPVLPGYEVTVNMTPADEVGGDYYDVINVAENYWIVIGDVSGHGVPAGLVMMMLQTSIKTVLYKNPHTSPAKLLSDINKVLTNNIRILGEDKFITITILACFPEGRFVFSGLHEDMMVYRSKIESVELIKTKGMWLGIKDDIRNFMEDNELILEDDDVLLLYTDGITEAFDKDKNIFSKKKLMSIFKQNGKKSTGEIKASILSELDDYKKHDDVTLIILKRACT
jgi:serine phosphatase RsbU (regulator of sigma subunit)